MKIGEVTFRAAPATMDVHGVDDMCATAYERDGIVWVSLGTQGAPRYQDLVALFFNGPGALAKAERLADAINCALAPAAVSLAAESQFSLAEGAAP